MPFYEWLMAEFWETSSAHSLGANIMAKRYRKIKKSSGKGKTFRPCHVCFQTVNFVPWPEESILRKKKIWHWANEDGSHHIHFESTEEVKHLRDILIE